MLPIRLIAPNTAAMSLRPVPMKPLTRVASLVALALTVVTALTTLLIMLPAQAEARSTKSKGKITQPAPTEPIADEPAPTEPAPEPAPTPPASDAPADTALAPTEPPIGVGPRTLAPCSGVTISPGMSIQGAIDARVGGTTFCLAAGMHRISAPIVPKAGTIIHGEPGAILSGAKLLTGFTSGSVGWWVDGQTRESAAAGICHVSGDTTCTRNEDVYVDNQRLRPVNSLSALATGTFFFDRATDRITVFDDPTGRTVEVADTFRAFNGAGPATVRGLTVEKFANPAQSGAFHFQGAWTITDNVVRFNHGIGISGASKSLIAHNRVERNGQLGMSGTGSVDAIFEWNDVFGNNTAGFKQDWEAGGGKWVDTTGLIVRHNYVHDNKGPGLWTDIDNRQSLIERNFASGNTGPGIFHEISYAAEIRHNTVAGNGAGQTCPIGGWCSTGIRISESSDVWVHGNVVRGDQGSILGIQANRGSGKYGSYLLRNVTVRDNDISPGIGRNGVMQNVGDASIYTSRGITFTGNRYRLRCTYTSPFAWSDQALSFAGWQGVGHDTTGVATCS